MSALTSFDALHEPPPQPEEQPENVLSKLFQKVKSSLTTSSTPPPLTSGTNGSSSITSLGTTAVAPSFSTVGGDSIHPSKHNSGGNTSGFSFQQVSVSGVTDQLHQNQHQHQIASSASTQEKAASSNSSVGSSDAGSWITPSSEPPPQQQNQGSNNYNNGHAGGVAVTPKQQPGAHNGLHLPKITDDKDRTIVARGYQNSMNASRRASSLFKVSTVDHSIVQDDDSASLSSLAPPVVSLSPAFGDQQVLKDNYLESSSGPMLIRDSRAVDHSRLSAGDISATRDYLQYTLGARDASYDSDARSIRSFSSGHQKGNSLTKVIRRLRGEGVNRDYWMADENAKECFGCNASFFVFRRKHHCRICGHIFCSKCASKIIPGAKLGYEGHLRVCDYCLDIMQAYERPENGLGEYTTGTSWSAATTPSTVHHGHFPQTIPMSPSIQTTPADGTPLDGIRKFLHAGSNLFLARSRSNTTTGDQGIDGGPAPFRRSLALEDGNMHDSVLDPEIAPFMGEEDDDGSDDLWVSNSPNAMGFLSLGGPYDDNDDSDDEFLEYSPRDRGLLRTARTDEFRDRFVKDRSPHNRRISVNGTRPSRHLSISLKTRGLLCSDGSESVRSPLDMRPSSPYLGSNSQALMHVGRHSRAASMVTGAVELNNASLQHMRRLLRQLLTRFEIDNRDGWDEVIMKLVLKVSNSIQILDGMDVMQVVKIKKIPGGTAQDTLYINGVVCTKNLAHKQMSRTLVNPKILILRFALEYQRVENHFISLEPIVNQEKEYLRHLVARIVALSPHLIVVEKTVSRLALEMLLKQNVAVAYNVKPEVTDAIAHSTGADIILSFDKLDKDKEPRLGTCGSFEVKTYVHDLIPNKRKSYMFFQDCPGNIFCSLVLRGGSLETLNRIKKVVRLMVWVTYNLKLETSLMNDQFAMTSAVRESRLLEEETVEISSDPDIGPLQEMLKPYKQTILSASPFVKFAPPFLLTRMIADAEKLKKIEQTTTPSALRDIGNAKVIFATSSPNAVVNKSSTGRSQDSGIIDGAYIDISNDFNSKSRAWEDFLSSNIGPALIVPFAYQNLAFLFSNICTTTRVNCVPPVIRLIQYYMRETDVTLAHYLEQICWESNLPCPSVACGRPLRDHQRIYAHGDAKVAVTVEQWEPLTTVKKESIMMWSKCRICNVETPQAYLSEDTKNYSFGKFLELIFYQTNLTCRANICPHDINQDHIRYFGLDTQLVRIERVPIRLFDINFPPMLVRCKPEFSARSKNQDLDVVRDLITRYWDSVTERIKNCIFDVVQPDKIEAAKQELLEMSRNVVVEKKSTLQLLQQTYLNSAPTDTVALNLVRIKLYEKAVAWNKIFGDFARVYFNPDRDRRSATQLRRLFDDKDFPVASDRAHHATLLNDLPISLDSSENFESNTEDFGEVAPSDLPYLGSSPTLDVARPKVVEDGNVAALESAIDTASSQITFPFMEPKVTRRLSMNLMQEFRPKLVPTLTSDSILTVTDEVPSSGKPKTREVIAPAPVIPRIPLPPSNRSTTRVSSRLSMVSLPAFDPMTLIQQERKENQQMRSNLFSTPGLAGTPSPSGQTSPFGAVGSKIVIPLDRTPTHEKPGSASSTSSNKNPFFFNKPRTRRPTETSSTTFMAHSSSPHFEKPHSVTGSLSSTNLNSRRSVYLAKTPTGREATGGIPIPVNSASNAESGSSRIPVGNRNRALTQPNPGYGNARSRYMNALSNHSRNPRPLETKQPTIEVFSSVKEAAKEESEDDDDYQSEGEGDEPYQPSRGYTFSLIQTDAMDEALGSEDPASMMDGNASIRNHGAGATGAGGSSTNNTGTNEDFFMDPVMMMFLGDDDYSSDQQSHHQKGSSSTAVSTPNRGTGTSSGLNFSSVGSPPIKTSSVNLTVSGTISAAMAVASKLPQLSEEFGADRGSLIKTLSNFWQDRTLANFTALDYPMQPFEHVFSYSQIIVREDEPSSIIALTLSSPQYVEKLKGIFTSEMDASLPHLHRNHPQSNSGTATPSDEIATVSPMDGHTHYHSHHHHHNHRHSASSSSYGANSNPSSTTEGIYDDIHVSEESLLSEPGTHMKFPFLDGSTMLYCKIFYMEQFHALRKAAGCEYSYIQSLARCMKWDATGGKSGSSFLKTRDDRFIMKQLSKVELEAFIKFAPHYFQYMQKAIYHKRPTVLAKIFGFYRVGYKHGALGRSMNMDVLIMENLFYDRKNLQVFDLKGSRRNRYVQPSGKDNEVLLDENFIEYMADTPFYIREHAKLQLIESLANDSGFLQRFNIMDYSLLVAVTTDDKEAEVVVGIVDFIRPFTWDKQLESWVKDAVGSREPTIVSPAQYRKRFRSAMNRHLDMVPDRWFDIESSIVGTIVHRSIGRAHDIQDPQMQQRMLLQQQRQQQQQQQQPKQGHAKDQEEFGEEMHDIGKQQRGQMQQHQHDDHPHHHHHHHHHHHQHRNSHRNHHTQQQQQQQNRP